SEKELKLAEHLIELMEQEFDPSQYEDHYREALQKVVEAKLEGKEVVAAEAVAPKGKVIDLMDALRASVDSIQQSGKPSLKSAAKATAKQIDEAEERKTAAHTAKTKRTGSTRGKRKASA